MLLTIEHSGHTWTALRVRYNKRRTIYFWSVEELFIRYPPFCKKAQRKYRKKYGHRKGIAEGTAIRNCDCRKCKHAWSHRNGT